MESTRYALLCLFACIVGLTNGLPEDAADDPCDPNPCLNDVNCYVDWDNDFYCFCKRGFDGLHCENKVDPTCGDKNPCLNGGTCMGNGEDSYCRCDDTYGDHCQHDPCKDEPCKNGGTCFPLFLSHRYSCNCDSPYWGKNCEKRNTQCDDNPCMNGGTCRTWGGDHWCTCPSGVYGESCEINYCSNQPCLNGGTCFGAYYRYYCLCADGYNGESCEYHACLQHPCGKGGSCIALLDTYYCYCPDGSYGQHC